MWKIILVFIVGALSFVSPAEIDVQYDFKIDSEGHVFEGYVFPNVRNGDKVAVSIDQDETFLEQGRRVNYLRLTVRERRNNQTKSNYIVADTDAFIIDEDNYIIINNSDAFHTDKEIEFYVVMVAKKDNRFVSNPIPFVVRMESKATEDSHYSTTAAIFAGVLVLIIVLLALLIPFFVRAKRRQKAGKPVFQLGSHQGSSEKIPHVESMETISGMHRNPSEPDWYGNKIFSYEDEVRKEKKEFTEDIKSTMNNSVKRQMSYPPASRNIDASAKYSARYIPKDGLNNSNTGTSRTGAGKVTINAQIESGEVSKL